jgi:hypothetical protein
MRAFHSIIVASLLTVGCNKGGADSDSANTVYSGLGCDHDVELRAEVEHAWPYPADSRDLRWRAGYETRQLRLKPTPAAFVTATISFRDGDLIRVLDSQVRIEKPRRLIAKRDLFITRRVWSQGVEVERTELAVAKGEVGNFLFYNSEGLCVIGTSEGPGWTPCTLDDAFEGLSAENPDPCEQEWWVQLQRSRADKGWMVVDLAMVERLPPATDHAAK